MPVKSILKQASRILPDKTYIQLAFFRQMGRFPSLEDPKTYNEKLQWLKLYDRKPLYTQLVDKYAVRKYIAEKLGEEYLIPLVGGPWDSVDQIDLDALPEQFVLKCNHDSGSVVICRDKGTFNFELAKRKLKKSLKTNYYWNGREWPYKNIKPRIIAEQYMVDNSDYGLNDYKFFCFCGKVKALYIATDRFSAEETKFDFYDEDFNHLPFTNGHPNSEKNIAKPTSFEEMKTLAQQLAAGLSHVRVDFYEIGRRVYFGELTFFHLGGMVPFDPPKWDLILGQWLVLPEYQKRG